MPFETWDALYHSNLQSPIALCVLPLAFLISRVIYRPSADRAIAPESHAFIVRYATLFAVLTMVDPICTGPISRALGISGSFAGTLVMFFFVLLGDYRVLTLVFGLADRANGTRRALAWTFIVPIFTGATYGPLLLLFGAEQHWMWLIYELSFATLALYLAKNWLPKQEELGQSLVPYLQSVLAYVLTYYVLWASADLILLAGLDEGWAVRIVPNQLYYAGFVPFAAWRFYRRPS